MTQTVEQEVLESKKFTQEVVVPGYKDILVRAWNRLLWEPKITFDPERPLIEAFVEAPSKHHEWKGFSVVTIAGEGVMRNRLFRETEDPNIFVLHNVGPGYKVTLSEYIDKVPQAERSLICLRDEQEEELKTSPDGRQVIWKPEQDLLGVTRTKVIGHPNAPVNVFVRQGRFYCPAHTDSELVEDVHYAIGGLTCPTNPDHFWVFTK